MGRMTRAQAAAISEDVHVDEDALLELSNSTRDKTQLVALEPEDRTPLAEIEPNGGINLRDGDSSESQSENQKPGKKGKKGGRKGAKNSSKKDTNALASSTTTPPNEPLEVVPDVHESAPSPASRAASDDLMKDQLELDMSHLPLNDIRPKTPQSGAVRLTRSQLRKVPSVEESAGPKPVEQQAETEQTQSAGTDSIADGGIQIPVESEIVSGTEPQPTAKTGAPVLPEPEAMPNTMQHNRDISPARLSTPTKSKQDAPSLGQSESMKSGTPYDKLEAAAVEAQTPPRSSKTSRTSHNDPIAALDELDEAVEKVNAEVPNVQPSPQKKSKKPAPVVRTTKASMARISIAHGPKDAPRVPSLGKPRPSTAFGESTAKRVTSVSSDKSDDTTAQAPEKKEAVIPHSKPRPISMSFPAPKPPPKSTKAPTKSTFQLPGEAVAAKLKAAKEARLQKEAEDQQKKKFKARPAPTMNKAPTIRQTSASKARESIISGKPLATSTAHKRANSVATTKPTIAPAKPKPLATSKTGANRMSVVPSNSSTIKLSKRPSTAMATLSKPRPSTAAAIVRPPRPMSVISGGATGTKTAKGKEVFNRAAQAKSAAEKEKREKEEAAKKARAAAAERGRQASREWAEKQRLRKLGAKPAATAEVTAVAVEEPVAEVSVEIETPAEAAVLAEA